jgi:hypothetical protein
LERKKSPLALLMQIKRNDRKYFYVSSLISFILKHFYSTLKRGGGERERERERKRERREGKEGREHKCPSVMRDYHSAP